ncbi:MAG: S-methyl-5-thioribose-1-phosphate isomerase [Candidatus Tectomicrobia bacterium]|nr:S-methyl-5-thioribose-1-phosphate isomerase [Candidatus Tectomicrobia bacterium]
MIRTIEYRDGKLVLIDQRKLPLEETYVRCADHREVAEAIRGMVVRGAPAIGVTAAYGMALAAREAQDRDGAEFLGRLEAAAKTLGATRPTAVNLFWAIGRSLESARAALARGRSPEEAAREMLGLAHEMLKEDIAVNRRIGDLGAGLLPANARVLTHCNAGALATAGYGTAAGVIRSAHRQGKIAEVLVDETRPFLQGARLTAWELHREGIPVTLIPDGAAGFCMKNRKVDCVVVGADRIARNGDAANKIGTYPLAVLARENGVPFYVAAPTSTIDFALESGDAIPIEERSPEEVTHFGGRRIAPEGVRAFNPAFDVTPARLVDALVTERGIVRPSRGETPEVWAPGKTS